MTKQISAHSDGNWLALLRWYFPFVFAANLIWETVHLPLYTVWQEGTPAYLIFVVLHCTGGDLLIALAATIVALLVAAPLDWPKHGFSRTVALATTIGVSYTIFSEWLNTVVRKSWTYSDVMPVVPVIDAGLSPLLQWLIIPPTGLWLCRRLVAGRLSRTSLQAESR